MRAILVIDQSTVSGIIYRLTTVPVRPHIVRSFIPFPVQLYRKHWSNFFVIAQFLGVIGAIDGTHIRILAPSENEPESVNGKKLR